MKKIGLYSIGLVAIATFIFLLTKGCGKKAVNADNPAFASYVSAYTSGVVSKVAPIRIKLTDQVADVLREKGIPEKLFHIVPKVKGKLDLVENTLQFVPDVWLESDKKYHVEFDLDKIVKPEKELETFVFEFKTIKQAFSAEITEQKTTDRKHLKFQQIRGEVNTADAVKSEDLPKILTVKYPGKDLHVKWSSGADMLSHFFVIDSIERKDERSELLLEFDGDDIDADQEFALETKIPALGEFYLMNARVYQEPQQYLRLQFSDPLDENQDPEGLIAIQGCEQMRYQITDNIIQVFPEQRIDGTREVTVYPGILNILHQKSDKKEVKNIAFEALKPAVRLIGKGNILPSNGDGLMFPFETVNLKAVDVTVIKIYENNIMQFLQSGDYDNAYNLRPVAKPILRKRIDLDKNHQIEDYNAWHRFSIDLSSIIEPDPGAIYRIELDFKKAYSTYRCSESENEEAPEDNSYAEDSKLSWDTYEYEDYAYYNWQDRDNPCKPTYYMGDNHKVGRNIIASNLGIIAKKSNNGNLYVYVTDLLTTQPKSGAVVEIYDFQQQLLFKGETNNEGILNVTEAEEAYFVILKAGKQRGYLKLNNGNSLSMSRFNIEGEEVKDGIQGFIYTERGVYRPGDKIYASFILNDKQNPVPEGHPITFLFTDPQGKTVSKEVLKKTTTGFYTLPLVTEPDAITGNYTLTVSAGPVRMSKIIKVETIKPNRLKIKLEFDGALIREKRGITGELQANYLHGTPGRNMAVQTTASLSPLAQPFPDYKQYTFSDPSKQFTTEGEEFLNGKTNEQGNYRFQKSFDTDDKAPGMMKLNLLTKVFENGGNFSISQTSVKYSPYEGYVGIKLPEGDKIREGMLLTDRKHKIQIKTLTPTGKPLKESHSISLKFYKLSWRWWFDASGDYVTNYNLSTSSELLDQKILQTSGGNANWEIEVKYPDWGRYFVWAKDLKTGHSCGKIVYIDWPGWASRAVSDGGEDAGILTFVSDKPSYKIGETATVTLPSAEGARALVTIENGSDVLKSFWVKTEKESTPIEFDITPEMTPNIYVHISLIQEHSQTINDRPIRMYGVIPVMIENPDTKLTPEIKMPKEIQTGKPFVITVGEKERKAMTYTIAVVDEGLLDLTNFETPNPWQRFFARQSLGVSTWDLYREVIGAYTDKPEQIFAIGGGYECKLKDDQTKQRANRFRPVVKFMGPFVLKKGEKKKHKITIDKYIGSVRTMVIAGDVTRNAYGAAEETTPVIKPLMLLGTLPRTLSPGETVELPVSIFAMKKNIKTAQVKLKVNDKFEIEGSAIKNVTFNNSDEEIVNYTLKVKDVEGIGKVTLTATSGNEKAEHEFEIDVLNPNPNITQITEKVIPGGQSFVTDYTALGIEGSNTAALELSIVPPINLNKRLNYLLQYPHGCLEQTTSSVFPQLFLYQMVDLDKKQQARIQTNIKAGIKRLESFRLPGGGFSYWPGNNNVDVWATNYAGHFLIEAQKQGYIVPAQMIKSWRKYQQNKAKKWINDGSSSQLIQAYRLYTLALAGYPVSSAMNRLKNTKNLSQEAQWRLAAAYFITGKKQTAKNMIRKLTTAVKPYKELRNTYGTSTRDKAMILETLVLLKDKMRAFQLMKEIAENLSSDNYMSTQTTAYALLAVSKYLKSNPPGSLKANCIVDGKSVNIQTNKSVADRKIPIRLGKTHHLKINNTGKSPLFVRLVRQGKPKEGAPVNIEKELRMKIRYMLPDGKSISPQRIRKGTDFIAEVELTHPGILKSYYQMALTQVFPSGWEIINTRLFDGIYGQGQTSTPEYLDIRDDRVYTYFNLGKGTKKVFRVLLNASYAGRFWMPPVHCSAMYDNAIYSTQGGTFVTVEP